MINFLHFHEVNEYELLFIIVNILIYTQTQVLFDHFLFKSIHEYLSCYHSLTIRSFLYIITNSFINIFIKIFITSLSLNNIKFHHWQKLSSCLLFWTDTKETEEYRSKKANSLLFYFLFLLLKTSSNNFEYFFGANHFWRRLNFIFFEMTKHNCYHPCT